MIVVKNARFKLGQIVATPGALEALSISGQSPWDFLARHVQGDWGEVDAEDKQSNEQALSDGSRLLSAYTTKAGDRIWIITEADRSSSCLLTPDEY
jgi:hypothetical protein